MRQRGHAEAIRQLFSFEDDWINPPTPSEALAGMLFPCGPEQMLAPRVHNQVYLVGREAAMGSGLRRVR